jgi:ribose transport system ATP-binding protein
MSLSVRFQHIVKEFGPVRVLHGVDFALEPGRVVWPAGRERRRQVDLDEDPGRLRAPTGGQLLIDGIDRTLPTRARRRRSASR